MMMAPSIKVSHLWRWYQRLGDAPPARTDEGGDAIYMASGSVEVEPWAVTWRLSSFSVEGHTLMYSTRIRTERM